MQQQAPIGEGARPSLAHIFLSFLKLGATAFGGPAMLAPMRRMVVQRKGWLKEQTFRSGVALCQMIPGATAMQSSAYVGLKLRGAPGAAASFIGFGLPAFLLMGVLSYLYGRFESLPAVASAFHSLRALVVAFIAYAAVTFGRSYLKRWPDFLIGAAAAAAFRFGLSPIFVVLGAAVLGVLLSWKAEHGTVAADSERTAFPLVPLVIILCSAAAGLVVLYFVDRKLLSLSLLMMKVDVFAFGGGFASVPLMLHEMVDVRHWMTQKTFMDGIALGQVTPGPIVITATFVGYIIKGPVGAAVATASIFLPSFLMVLITAPIFGQISGRPLVRKAINGVLCSFVGLLVSTVIRFGLQVSWDIPSAALSAAAFVALLLQVNYLWVVPAGIVVAILLSFVTHA
jgi:chromate transporter